MPGARQGLLSAAHDPIGACWQPSARQAPIISRRRLPRAASRAPLSFSLARERTGAAAVACACRPAGRGALVGGSGSGACRRRPRGGPGPGRASPRRPAAGKFFFRFFVNLGFVF